MKYIVYVLSLLFSISVMAAPGVVVLSGGGPEGDIGVTTDWSYSLYKKLIENGDTTKDGKIKVVVLSLEKPDTNFMVDYLKSMGADSSENLVISSKKDANDPKLVKTIADADVVFIRGGNQGKAYQLWKDTKLHQQIKALADRGGAIGGTSSGAMGLSEYSMTGGLDFASQDILEDSHSPLMDDSVAPNTSGIHNDFIDAVPGVLVDTHCGERARMGRILGVQAKAIDDYKDKKILGICLEEKTGVVVKDGKAEVFGTGTAHFTQETSDTKMIREKGKPLVYTDIRDDALTEGWVFDLKQRLPDLIKSKPAKVLVIDPGKACAQIDDKFLVEGQKVKSITFDEMPNSKNILVVNDALSDDILESGDKKRGGVQTNALKKLYDNPDKSILFLAEESKLKSVGNNDVASVKNIPGSKQVEVATMILDCQYCSYKTLSSFVSNQDDGSETLHSPGLVNMRVHVISGDAVYNAKTHQTKILKASGDEDLEHKCNLTADESLASSVVNSLKDKISIVDKIECK